MIKKIVCIAFVLLSTSAIAKVYNFKPIWKVGDKKHITITANEKEFINDSLVLDTVYVNEAEVKIQSEAKKYYRLKIKFENQVLRSAALFYDKLGEELQDYKDLTLVYKVDKKTGKAELVNWKEAKVFMDNSFEQMEKLLEEKSPDVAPFFSMAMSPVLILLKDKKGIEEYMMSNVGYLISIFNHDFEEGNPAVSIDSTENPFNPKESISQTTTRELLSVDKQNKVCEIKEEVELDLSSFITMIKGMMKSMGKSFGVSDSSLVDKEKELDDFSMDMINESTIYYNYKSGWVERVVKVGEVISTDPKTKEKKKKSIVTKYVVKDFK
ncbi:MAG: hypothetical protein ACJAZ2_000337 [Glaciecola sp.]|jgi:hypothetical protein